MRLQVLLLILLALTLTDTVVASFYQDYRVPAGVPIPVQKLRLGGVVNLTDIFGVQDVDHDCRNVGNPKINNSYLAKLNMDLSDCVFSASCHEFSWDGKGILQGACIGNVTAINIRCNYGIPASERYISSRSPAVFDVEQAKQACSKGKEIAIDLLVLLSGGNMLLNFSDEDHGRLKQVLSDVANACEPPCKAFSVSPLQKDYGHSSITGSDYRNNIKPVPNLKKMFLFYQCVKINETFPQGQDFKSLETTWMTVAVLFIVFCCILLMVVTGALICFFKRRKSGVTLKKLELNNNRKVPSEVQMSPTKPYAVNTIALGNRKPVQQQDSYEYVDDHIMGPTSTGHNHSTIPPVDDYGGHYESIRNPAQSNDYENNSQKRSDYPKMRRQPGAQSSNNNEGRTDRADVSSYIVFDDL